MDLLSAILRLVLVALPSFVWGGKLKIVVSPVPLVLGLSEPAAKGLAVHALVRVYNGLVDFAIAVNDSVVAATH